jgi:hypothetical protein
MPQLVPGRLLAATAFAASLLAAPLLTSASPVSLASSAVVLPAGAPCTYQQTTQSGTPCYNAQTDLNNQTGQDFTSQSRRNDDWQKMQRGGY